jgi:outer membrane protein assembly factor BamB
VGGINLTARTPADQGGYLLRDLAIAVCELASGSAIRRVVRFYDSPWEIGLQLTEDQAIAFSVARNGVEPEVIARDHRIAMRAAVTGILRALVVHNPANMSFDPALSREWPEVIAKMKSVDSGTAARVEHVTAIVEPDLAMRCVFAAEFPLWVATARGSNDANASTDVADLHSLLGAGKVRAIVRGREKNLGELPVFYFCERLVGLAFDVLEHMERGQTASIRVDAMGAMVGVTLAANGETSLTLISADAERNRQVFPALEGADVVETVVSFGRNLVRAIVRRDSSQKTNLRVQNLRKRLRDLRERLRALLAIDDQTEIVSPAAERNRLYLSSESPVKEVACPPRMLRYEHRWSTAIAGLDLRGTFLCGDRLIVTGEAQTACLSRADGECIWQLNSQRGISLPTPGGLARLRTDGRLELLDFGDGSVVWSTECEPRKRGTSAACTVAAAGLPKLLVASEGDNHLVAFDLTSGEARWRRELSRPGCIRIRRIGRLLVLSTGEAHLAACDVSDGQTVFRVTDKRTFVAPVAADRDDLVAIAGEPNRPCGVHVLDAASGRRKASKDINIAASTDTAPMLTREAIVIVTRDRRGIGLIALHRESLQTRWHFPPGTWPAHTSVLAVDDLLVLNLPTGECVALSADSGITAWSHVFSAPVSGDAPRRLEPVLRSGALFVPQDIVRVIRPSDGRILGSVNHELIPDLLRVDERCDVYIVEESGHIAALRVAASLDVISGGGHCSLTSARTGKARLVSVG